MRRSLLVALVVLSLVRAAPPDDALAQGDPCALQASDRWEYVDVAGPWERRGMALDVDPRGCGTLSWGDGVAQPHASAGFVLDAREDRVASGHIIDGADGAGSGGVGIVLRLEDDGTLTVERDGTPTALCRPWAWITERCGA